jgi:predicted transcriptional regulator
MGGLNNDTISDNLQVHMVMVRKVVIVGPDAIIKDPMNLMRCHQNQCLPIPIEQLENEGWPNQP